MRLTSTAPLLAVLLLAAAARSQAGEPPAPAPVAPAVLRAIRVLHDPEAPPHDVLIQRIVEAGPPPVDAFLRFLEEGRIDACFGTGLDFDPMDGDAQLMNRYQQKLILEVLERVEPTLVQSGIERLLERSQEPPAVAAAVLCMGAVGDADQLRKVFELAGVPTDGQRVDPAIERALEQGVADLLVDDPAGFGALAACWQQLPEALMPSLVRAVGATADGRGVELLGQVLVWSPEYASLAVAQLRRLGPSPDQEVNEHIANELRTRLDPLDPGFCRAAILALAELDDFHAVPQLIDLLETAPAVEENALWALQRLAGRSWANSPDWWRSWYTTELDWHENVHPRLSRVLSEAIHRDKQVEILREYAKRRLFRHDLALEVTDLLESPDRPLRLLAIETLTQLESRAAIPALVELLGEKDECVSESALNALRIITGETHPVDSPAWGALARIQ